MKKSLILLIIPLLTFVSCATVKQSKFVKSPDAKAKVISKYGKANSIEKQDVLEIWHYEYENNFQSNRKVVFDGNGNILENKKMLKPIPYTFRYVFIPGTVILVSLTTIVLINNLLPN